MLITRLDGAKFALTTFLAAGLCLTTFAQQNTSAPQPAAASTPATTPQSASGAPSDGKPLSTPSPADARQEQLRADTEKLYQLTQELKAEVAKSNKDTLSISVIKKAEEVEKLARSLKERMKTEQ
jgi:hypothetical protein